MLPFYFWAPQIWSERMFYAFLPIWRAWFRAQPLPDCNVVHAITGFATEPFDRAEKIGALKVADCPNSHPVSLYGFWQRECDLWCPGRKGAHPAVDVRPHEPRTGTRGSDLVPLQVRARLDDLRTAFRPEKVILNPFGVDTSVFTAQNRSARRTPLHLVGTICLRKGHQYLFRAFEIVKRRLPEAELICVGGYKQDFRKEKPKWAGTFTQYQSLPHPKLADLLRTCTAFVFPSREEGLARVIPEAMAGGFADHRDP